MKAQLKCITLGFPFGEIIEVGSEYIKTKDGKEEKVKVTKDDIAKLIEDGHAIEVSEKVVVDAKELQKRNAKLQSELDALKEEKKAK